MSEKNLKAMKDVMTSQIVENIQNKNYSMSYAGTYICWLESDGMEFSISSDGKLEIVIKEQREELKQLYQTLNLERLKIKLTQAKQDAESLTRQIQEIENK